MGATPRGSINLAMDGEFKSTLRFPNRVAQFLGFVIPEAILQYVYAALLALATYVGAWIVRHLFLRTVEHAKTSNVLVRRVGRVLQAIVVLVGVLAIFAVLSIDVSSVIIGLGAVSIAVSFALSTLLNNLVAGVLIAADDSVRVGDTIKVGELQGRVVRMRARASELETAEGRRVFVPNVYLAQNPIVRLGRGNPPQQGPSG
jgi:small-conductance mechanosensitive channel